MLDEIVRLRHKGMKIKEISEVLEISRDKVNRALKKYKNMVELVDTDTSEIIKMSDIKYEEKLYHYIKVSDGDVNTNMFYNLLENTSGIYNFIHPYSKQTIRNWSKKKSYIDIDTTEMGWLYALYHQQSNVTYKYRLAGNIRVASGADFYGSDKWRNKSENIYKVLWEINEFGYSSTLNYIENLENSETNAPLKFYYFPVAKVLWFNYGEQALRKIWSLPSFVYYRTKGHDKLPLEMKKKIMFQQVMNQAVLPINIYKKWEATINYKMEDIVEELISKIN